MKKLLLGICIPILFVGCNQNRKQNGNTTASDSTATNKKMVVAKAQMLPPPTNTFTLDGIPSATADQMVNAFIKNEGYYDHKHHTCIWFCKQEVSTMYKAVTGIPANIGNPDGIRLYFARTLDAKSAYTTVVVATLQGNPNSTSFSGHDHNDYFFNTNPLLGIDCGNSYRGLGDTIPTRGARLYDKNTQNPCAGTTQCRGTQSGHYITCAEAYKMVYQNCGQGGNNDKINATSEWFDISVVGDVMRLIPDGGGLRVYYAKHSLPGYSDTKARHGFVLIVTALDPQTNVQKDQFICLPQITPKSKRFMLIDPGDGGTDNGEQCPNSCGGTTWNDPGQN